MKKLLAIVLVLTFVLSIGVMSFAADKEVTGTLADGTVISKPVSEVVKDKDSALAKLKSSNSDKYNELSAFFENAAAGKTVFASGVANFGGFFKDVTESVIKVPVAVESAKAGDRFFVVLSNGSARTVRCEEDGIVPVSLPKDAENLGYLVAAALDTGASEEAPATGWVWTEVKDADGNVIGMDGVGPNGETENVRFDENGNVISDEYKNPNNGDTYSYSATYDDEGNLTHSESAGSFTDENGKPFEYGGTYDDDGNGNITETSYSKGTNDQGENFDYSRTSKTDPDGNTTTVENVSFTDSETGEPIASFETTTNPDGTSKEVSTIPGRDPETETHYYDADGNEIFPSPQW